MMSEVKAVGADAVVQPTGTHAEKAGGQRTGQVRERAAVVPPGQVDAIVKELNEAMRIINTSITFSVDKPTGKTVIRVMDADTKQVIRQIPSEEMMRVAERITQLLGVLFDKTR
jgi:flagellar protein FlaG